MPLTYTSVSYFGQLGSFSIGARWGLTKGLKSARFTAQDSSFVVMPPQGRPLLGMFSGYVKTLSPLV